MYPQSNNKEKKKIVNHLQCLEPLHDNQNVNEDKIFDDIKKLCYFR
jgi:hypothetical protein